MNEQEQKFKEIQRMCESLYRPSESTIALMDERQITNGRTLSESVMPNLDNTLDAIELYSTQYGANERLNGMKREVLRLKTEYETCGPYSL